MIDSTKGKLIGGMLFGLGIVAFLIVMFHAPMQSRSKGGKIDQGSRADIKINEIAEMAAREAAPIVVAPAMRAETVRTFPPPRFGSFALEVVTQYSISLQWNITDVSTTSIAIDRKPVGGQYLRRHIGLVTTFVDSPVDPATAYSYHVVGFSGPSNTAGVGVFEGAPSNELVVPAVAPTPTPSPTPTATATPRATATSTATATATATATIPPASPAPTATATATSTATIAATPTATVAPSPVPDFTLSIVPLSQTVGATQTYVQKTYTVTETKAGGFNTLVALTVTGLPPSIEPRFEQVPTNTKRNLTLFVTGFVPPGSYTFTVTGTGGNPVLTRTCQAVLIKN